MFTNSEIPSLRKIVAGLPVAILAAGALLLFAGTSESADATEPDWGPTYTGDGKLILPTGYHEWVFLGSPLTPHALNGGNAAFPEYHNVYVQPEAFRAYRETGDFPEGTILLKELQLTRKGSNPDGSGVEVSGRGYFPGARNGIDISVKDKGRFAASNGWGFFNFGHHSPPYPRSAAAQPIDACAGCHIASAEGMVFRKFYRPILDAE